MFSYEVIVVYNQKVFKYRNTILLMQIKEIKRNGKKIREGVYELNGKVHFDRTNKNYEEWRKKVLERDKYKCQNPHCLFCNNNEKDVILEVHHIAPIKRDNGELFDTKNSITLCRTFHNCIKNREKYYKDIFLEIVKKNEV